MSLFTSYPHPTHRSKKTSGFTIVELLIVIVVIAILAAISIVAYNGIQNRAYDTTIQSDLSTLAKKYELYKIDSTNNKYPVGNDQLATLGFRLGNKDAYAVAPNVKYNLINCTNYGVSYVVTAVSKSSKKFYIASANGGAVKEYTGTNDWTGDGASVCGSISTGLVGDGAGYNEAGGWRAWTN
ncbi:MAG: type II secretion system protein [Candidatus Saccharimonas sp.]